ncbi:MAG: type II secretion system GspH family protein [Candidatus Muirbacterium halophilum]|nr:type II secretion system GspH family protein [Candidatus Muirbacterium halophilum]MCK9475319.1 type II secretion system GspH family protein [Candidatus Muirbacterium halophilum]
MKKGFSVVEVLIAMGFFLALVIPYIAMFITSAKDVRRIGNMNVAILFAQEAIEACKGYPYELLDSDDAGSHDKALFLEEAFKSGERKSVIIGERDEDEDDLQHDFYWHKATVNGIEYTRDVDIAKVDTKADKNGDPINLKLKLIKVNVSWEMDKRTLVYTASAVVRGK